MTAENVVTVSKGAESYVGFANLPNQVYRKSVKRGFEFNLMVVGESGLGKSTLLNSLFLTDVYVNAPHPGPLGNLSKTLEVQASTFELRENNVQLTLTVVDTPGFGDNIDNTDCWEPVISYINSNFEHYLNAESRINRTTIQDTRVHCCLYFISPSGHGLRPLDIEFMKRLHDKVNIVPVIAKADTLTPEECTQFKKVILREIEANNIAIYKFPDSGPEDDEDRNRTSTLKDRIPFAVVGSTLVMEINGRKIRGRRYPWGIVEVDSLEHCDFTALKSMLIRTHMQDLIDVTNYTHYENFRSRNLSFVTGGVTNNSNPMEQLEREKEEQDRRLKKMESEMEQVFESKVKEKREKLKQMEMEQMKKFDLNSRQMIQKLHDLEARRSEYEKERVEIENLVHIMDSSEKDKKKDKKGLFKS